MEAMYESSLFDPEFPEGPANPRPLPGQLDSMAPGPVLGAYLASVEPDRLTGYDRVVALRAFQRMESYFTAKRIRATASVADVLHDDDGHDVEDRRAAEAELRCALHLTRRAAESDIDLSLGLRDRLPRALDSLERGDIDLRRARVLHTSTAHLDEDVLQEVVDRVITDAPSLTTGQIRSRVDKLSMTADPDTARKRMEAAVEERRVVVEPNPSGTANLLIMDLLPHQASAAKSRLIHLARNTRRKGDRRTSGQIQADAAIDLLTRASTDRVEAPSHGGGVDIRVDLTTLAELNEHPGHLAGYGPVIADIARKVADDQQRDTWTYAVSDPGTGEVVQTGTTRRRPSVALRRAVEARYQTCVFPGCRMPSTESDIDHSTPWASGGPTSEPNLKPLCRHDHVIKTENGWRYRVTEGQVVWTSPLGHTYPTARPPP